MSTIKAACGHTIEVDESAGVVEKFELASGQCDRCADERPLQEIRVEAFDPNFLEPDGWAVWRIKDHNHDGTENKELIAVYSPEYQDWACELARKLAAKEQCAAELRVRDEFGEEVDSLTL